MTPVIEIEALRKEYRGRKGHTVAVDGLSLSVAEGGVFGFLGPNGSGKTTTIRCLLGLVRPSAGSARLFGEAVPAALPGVMPRIGSIVESPAFFPTISGRENLIHLATISGASRSRVGEVLEEVGLAERGGHNVAKYSLGMRQRLGLAAALLKDPALVVLDEPANGLDPAGIRQVRRLLRRLGDEGRTVFVSSHILAEVEQTCDRVAILNQGRLITQGTVAEVVASAGDASLRVQLDDVAAGLELLRRAGLNAEQHEGHLRVGIPDGGPGQITRLLAERQLWVTELRTEAQSLEDLFLELTNADDPSPAPRDEADA